VAMTHLSVMSAPSFAQKTPAGKGAGGLGIAAVDFPRVQPRHVVHVQIPLGGAGHPARRIGVPACFGTTLRS